MSVRWINPSTWGSTDDEAMGPWPGDELISELSAVSTTAISITGSASGVWPWLVQIGQDRGGFYSYDFLERLFGFQIHNAETIHDCWQRLEVGDRVRLHPRMTPLTVGIVKPGTALVLMAGKELGAEITVDPTFMRLWSYDAWTWGLYLNERGDGTTRFIARLRTKWPRQYTETIFNGFFIWPLYFVMQRRMCFGLKERVERTTTRNGN